ncbi:hypothetical protein [Nitrosospira multiformis]|uniref:Death domain-containing protein n=1 Tax=Nitrosospira multiformis (strain ATCC 25196 / NCIMB 11849 / C 71) TaxID=323848 RepID=A0A1H5XAB3_NITMU|nr:hypothetical protein [Nitrosospira multiformis]SDZ89494.1 hypothetical protein SAMN05216411_102318 [Nitrosospira multiformis]SEG08277.1 hypothetical protein SAMN05216403_12810 [Nitrosospira multiformis ATCC 25196]
MKREYQIGNDQLIDHILKLWNLGLEESQRALIDLIRSLDETTRQEVLQVLEQSVSGEGRVIDRLKKSR